MKRTVNGHVNMSLTKASCSIADIVAVAKLRLDERYLSFIYFLYFLPEP